MKFYQALFIFFSALIGTGIFFTPIVITNKTGEITTQFFVWITIPIIFLMYATVFSKMIDLKPKKGSIYEYIKVLNRHVAFIGGWTEYLAVIILIAFLINLSLNNLNEVFPLVIDKRIIELLIILLFTYIGTKKAPDVIRIMAFFGGLSILTFSIFYVYSLINAIKYNVQVNIPSWQGINFNLLPLYIAAIFETYAGSEILGYFATKKDKEILSKATRIGAISVVIFYTTLITFLLPLIMKVGNIYSISEYGRIVYALASIQILGTAFIWLNSAPNLLYRMSKDNNLPRFFEKLNKNKIPINSLLFTSLLVILLSLSGYVESLVKLYFVGILLVYSLVALAMLKVSERTHSKLYNKYSIISLVLLLFAALISTLYRNEALLFFPILIVGLTLYLSREFQRNKILVKIFHDIFANLVDWIWKLEVETDYPKIKKILGRLDNKVILDYGSSTGELTIRLAKDNPNAIIYATDISRRSLNILKKKLRKYRILNVVVMEDKPDTIYNKFKEFFDVIVVYHTVTLIKNRKLFFKSIDRALKNNGKVLFVYYKRFLVFDAPKWTDNLWKYLMARKFDVFVEEEKSIFYEKVYVFGEKL